MPADRVRVYTVAELERRATDYLARQFGAEVLVPVDVDLLVEKAEGITLDVWPKLQSNHKVLGMVLRDVGSGALFIIIDEDLADNDTPGPCPPPPPAHRRDPEPRRLPRAPRPSALERDRTGREKVRGDAPDADPAADGRSAGCLP